MKKELDLVRKYQKEMLSLGRANALLNWDQEVYMPEKGIGARAVQSSLLSGLIHQRATSDDFYDAVRKLMKSELAGDEEIMVRKLYKNLSKARKIPHELVEELSHATTLAGPAWRRARREKSFGVFEPYLKRIIELKRREAGFVKMRGHLYNGLLDDYEEGMSAEKLRPIFKRLKTGLIDLLGKIENSASYKKTGKSVFVKELSINSQKKFVEDVSERIGLTKDRSRIDLSEHPFTTKFGAGDVRITTAYRKDPFFAFSSTIHESGHALYELNLPEKNEYDVLGDAPSLGLHESQSRFWENNVGKSKSFWRFYFPKFKKEFSLKCGFDEFYKEVNSVEKGMIRIESDEVHYCLHVILRFEIELGLIDGSVKVKDLPKIWNGKMKEYFGKEPKNDVEGVLQDMHWSGGNIGYFPTYAIGTVYAAQLWNSLVRKVKGVEKYIEKGDFTKVREWLKENVHKYGSRYLAEDVIRRACGEGLKPEIYLEYLKDKYREIYRF